MQPDTRIARVLVATLVTLGLVSPSFGQSTPPSSIDGLWNATVTVNDLQIPFRIELGGNGASARGSFFNGDERVTSSSGRFEQGALVLEFADYATKLEATLADGKLTGRYDRGDNGAYPFTATRFAPAATPVGDVPAIGGLWNLHLSKESSKGELAWRLIVRQSGAEVSAAILRVDGDTGTLSGTYANGAFVLSHFSGARPSLFVITPQANGTLDVVQNGQVTLTAYREDDARAKGLPQPTDPSRFTSVKDPSEPFRFSFPDLQGAVVSNTDARFKGKVLLVNVSGSWCPNCHDEAPFLAELYRSYRGQGLEIVSLSFEESKQLANPVRLRNFIRRYGLEYTVLLAGEPKQASERIPQAVNLNAFPTTFFIGRDGLVRGTHAGFPGAASGNFHEEVRAQMRTHIEHLLAERPPSQ